MPKLNLVTGARIIETAKPLVKTERRLKNWIQAYRHYVSNQESPINYHIWTALVTIAGAAQRKVYMETEYFFVHTNMYVLLVGPPGIKKNTAMRQGKKMLREVPDINFTTSATSVTGMIQQFTAIVNKEHQSLTAFSYELGSLLSLSGDEMIDFLTDIYDGEPDWDKQTRQHGREKISHPWLNVIAGCTPSSLSKHLTSLAIEGGYVARNILVYEDELILTSPFPKKNPALAKVKKDLINDLSHISQLRGEFSFSPEAIAWYERWYLDRSRFPDIPDRRTQGYFVRKPFHLLKVAMAWHMAYSDELVLSVSDLEAALDLLRVVEDGMPRAFSSVGGNPTAGDMERIRDQIKASLAKGDPLEYGEIIALNYKDMDQRLINEKLQMLADAKEIKKVRVKDKVFYLPFNEPIPEGLREGPAAAGSPTSPGQQDGGDLPSGRLQIPREVVAR